MNPYPFYSDLHYLHDRLKVLAKGPVPWIQFRDKERLKGPRFPNIEHLGQVLYDTSRKFNSVYLTKPITLFKGEYFISAKPGVLTSGIDVVRDGEPYTIDGLKTHVPIKSGQHITEFVGYVVSRDIFKLLENARYESQPLLPLFPGIRSHALEDPTQRTVIIGNSLVSAYLTPAGMGALANHYQNISTRPNAKFSTLELGRERHIVLTATEDIAAGSMIHVDYGPDYLDLQREMMRTLEMLPELEHAERRKRPIKVLIVTVEGHLVGPARAAKGVKAVEIHQDADEETTLCARHGYRFDHRLRFDRVEHHTEWSTPVPGRRSAWRHSGMPWSEIADMAAACDVLVFVNNEQEERAFDDEFRMITVAFEGRFVQVLLARAFETKDYSLYGYKARPRPDPGTIILERQ